MAVLSFLGGLVGLIIGGHLLVDGASRIGARLGLTPIVVGLTIVAAGTSAPELAVVTQAIAAKDTELAVGSIIGSNIANVLLVLGLAACFGAIAVGNRMVKVDIPVMIGASVGLLVMSMDGRLGRLDGIVLFGSLIAFVSLTLFAARRSQAGDPARDSAGVEAAPVETVPARSTPRNLLRILSGVALLALASGFVVSGAEQIASALGVPELIIGLSIVAIGTSAPEIATTVIAALNGRRDLAVGNAVGSNIFNILLVLGITSALAPNGIEIGEAVVGLDLPIMVAAAVACLPFVFWDSRLDRWEGALFVAYYLAYMAFLVLTATEHEASRWFTFVVTTFVMPLTVVTVGVAIVRQVRHRKHIREQPPAKQTLRS